MAMNTPHLTDHRSTIPDETASKERQVHPRRALLALAGDLDDLGARCRLSDDTAGALLRCWDPRRQGRVMQVACVLVDGRLRFQYHPSGDDLGDAEAALQPGRASDAAHMVAATLLQP